MFDCFQAHAQVDKMAAEVAENNLAVDKELPYAAVAHENLMELVEVVVDYYTIDNIHDSALKFLKNHKILIITNFHNFPADKA